MNLASVEPPSTRSGRRGRPGGVAVLAGALLACLAATAPAADLSPQPPGFGPERTPALASPHPAADASGPTPPAVGATAPDIPLFDGDGKESSLREVLKDKTVVLVFYIGYT